MSLEEPTTKEVLLDAVIQTAGSDILDTIQPSNDFHRLGSSFSSDDDFDLGNGSDQADGFLPSCLTQDSVPTALENGPADIMISLNGECPRWVPGSVIRWSSWRAGFKSDEDAMFATNHLHMAAEKWNSFSIGVTFEWVPLAKDATFILCFSNDSSDAVAKAFFPNANDLSYLRVYSLAFSVKKCKDVMWKYFTHELGHVLGLRHEFAMDTNPRTGKPYEIARADQLGPRNESSVMIYSHKAPEIQQSDIDSTKVFYSLQEDAQGKAPKVGSTDVVDYTPM